MAPLRRNLLDVLLSHGVAPYYLGVAFKDREHFFRNVCRFEDRV
jgi:hypothetical protein